MKKNHFLSRLENEILAVAGDRNEWFQSCLQALSDHPKIDELMAPEHAATSEDDGFWPPADHWTASYRPYVVKNGVLMVPVMGVLLNRFPFQLGNWATGYTYIERAVRRGMEDEEIKGIAFICDTPGGEVSGNFELVDKIFTYRGQKPMVAIASERAYSAGYSIASAADQIVVTRSGGVGSIGVVTLHLDFSEQLNASGIRATFMFKGKYKVDGNSLEPLSAHAKRRTEARLDRVMDVFVSTVSRNRGLAEQVVRDTEADCFSPEEAVELGLADRIESSDDALVAFSDHCNSYNGEFDMTNPNDKVPAITQAQLDAAVADARTSAKAEGAKEGATAERGRINAIIGSEPAKTRGKAALSVALKSDMTVEAATAFLADLDEDKPVAAATAGETEEEETAPAGGKKPSAATTELFNAAMRGSNPEVGAGGEGGGKLTGDAAVAATLLADYRGATGEKARAA